jgi:hypothetical protein
MKVFMIEGAVRKISGRKAPTQQFLKAPDAKHSGFAALVFGEFPLVDNAVPYLGAKHVILVYYRGIHTARPIVVRTGELFHFGRPQRGGLRWSAPGAYTHLHQKV